MESAIPSLCLAILSANSEEVDRIVKTHGSSMLACPISHRQITLDPDVTQLLGSSTTGLNILQFSIAIGDDAVMDEELDEATLSKRKEIALRLIELSSSKDLMDSTWGEGNSTLHLGSTIGDIDVIKCLLSRNLNIHCKNRAGLTPLDVAADDETQSLFRQFRNNTRSTPAAAARDAKRSGNVERTSQTNKNLISSSSYTGKIDVQMTVTHKEVSVAVAAPAAEPIEKGQLRDIKEAASKTSSTVSLPFIAPTSSSINSELISLFATQTLLMAAPTTTMQTSITPAPITSHSTLKGSTSTSSLFNNPFLQADRDLVPVDQSTKNSSFFRNGGSLNSAKLKIVANDNEKARPSISSSISSATFPKNLASSAILKNSNWSAKRSLTSLDWSNSSESGIPASAIPTPPLPITAIDNTTEAQISATLTVNLPKVAEKESIASALPRTIITSPVVIVEKGGDKPDSVKSFRSSLTSSYGSRFQQQPPPKASDLIKKFDRPSNRVVGPSIVPSSQGVLGLGVGRSYPTTRNLKSLGYIKPALEAQTSPAIGINHIQKSSNHTTTPDSQEALPIVNIPATTISEDLMDAPAEPQFETKETDEYCPSLVDGEPDEKSPTYDFVCLEPKSSSLEDTAVIASSQPTPITIENQLNVEQVESTFSADKCLLDQFVGKKEGGIEDIEIIKSITISDLKIEIPKFDLGTLFDENDGWFANIIGSSNVALPPRLSDFLEVQVQQPTDHRSKNEINILSAAETDEEGSQDFIKSGRIEIEKVDLPLGTPSDLKPQEEEVAVAAAVEESTDARSEEGSMYESDRECSNDEDNSSSDHILNSKTKKQLKGALKHESTGPYSSHSKSRAQKMVKFESCWNGLLEKCKYIGSEDCESLKEREHGLGIMLFQISKMTFGTRFACDQAVEIMVKNGEDTVFLHEFNLAQGTRELSLDFEFNIEYCHEDKLTFEVASKALHLSEETTEAVTPSSSNGNLKDRATTSAKGTSRLLTSTKKFLGAFNKHRSNGSLSNFESASSLCELASDSSSYDLDHLSVSSPSNNNNASSSSSSIATAGSSSSITAQKRKYFSLGGLELKSDIITSNFTYKIGTLACELISILPRSESGIDVSEFDQQGIFGSIDIRACFIPYSSRIEETLLPDSLTECDIVLKAFEEANKEWVSGPLILHNKLAMYKLVGKHLVSYEMNTMKELNRYDLSMLDYAIGTGQEIYMHDDDHLEREVSRIERSLQDMRQQIAPLSVTSNDNITMADLACPENTGLETEEEWKLNGRADLIDMSLVLETDHLYIERNDFVLEFKRGEILRFKAPGRALSSAGSAEQEDNISSIIGNNESNDNNYNLYQMQPTVEILEWLKALANMSLTSSQLDLPEWVTCIRN